MDINVPDSALNLNQALEKALNQKLDPVIELERLRRMEYLNADDLAKLFSLEKNTLNTQRSRGTGPPFVKLGAKVLYSVDEVRAFLKQHTVKTLPHL